MFAAAHTQLEGVISNERSSSFNGAPLVGADSRQGWHMVIAIAAFILVRIVLMVVLSLKVFHP
jgi:hypothetical protein